MRHELNGCKVERMLKVNVTVGENAEMNSGCQSPSYSVIDFFLCFILSENRSHARIHAAG